MARRTPPNPNEIAIVTVHGTGDTAQGPDGDKWFQNGSAFAGRLKQRLASQGIEAAVVPHLWTGANSSQGRENGANTLAKTIKRLAKDYGGVHVVGHSHGGNVANDAATVLNWRRRKSHRQLVSSITSVGTPFFKRQLGRAEAFGATMFVAVSILSIVALLSVLLVVNVMKPMLHGDAAQYAQEFDEQNLEGFRSRIRPDDATAMQSYEQQRTDSVKESVAFAEEFGPPLRKADRELGWIIPFSAVILFFMVPLALQGYLRVWRIRRRQNTEAKVFSIWHPNDEAISFLRRIEELPIEPFPRWALWRSSRATGTLYGVRAVVWPLILAMGVSLVGGFGLITIDDTLYTRFGKGAVDLFSGLGAVDLGLVLAAIIVFAAPLLFAGAYVLTRVLRGFAFEMLGRGWLNTTVSSVLRGMAFGRDSEERIGHIATCSHTFGMRSYVVEGEVADRMRAGAATSASALIEKYRWALFTVGPDTNGAVNKLATDAMTWDSLIHTTYFDQPEIAEVIGDYIAENVERDREALEAKARK